MEKTMSDEEFVPVIFYECPRCGTKQDLHRVKYSKRIQEVDYKLCILCGKEAIVPDVMVVESKRGNKCMT